MESPGTGKFPGGGKRVVDELLQGRELAVQLQHLLRDSTGDHGLVAAEGLVGRIMKSITEVISVLGSANSGEVSEDLPSGKPSLPCDDGQKSEDSGDKRKKPASTDYRKGGCKRRKMQEALIETTSKPIEDGYSWRKYGQKEILNAKYPRSYFRCTHRHDQGCQATKQVQKTEDEIPMYRTTYIGAHTCRDVLRAPQFVLNGIPREALLYSFDSTKQEPDHGFSPLPSIKAEPKNPEEASTPLTAPTDHRLTTHDNQSSSDEDYLFLPDLKTLDSCGPTSVLPLDSPGSDYGDHSCTTSSHSNFDMDIESLMGSVDFDESLMGSVDFGSVLLNFDEEAIFKV